jgi:nucleoside phosphorylase
MGIRRLGIISGVPDELSAFLPDAPRQEVKIGGLAVQKVSIGDKDIYLLCTGIGKVAASTGAALLYARFDVELLVVIGTAAKISDIEGHVFNITEAVQGDFGAQRTPGLTHYTAGTLPIGPARVRAFEALHVPGLNLPEAKVATSDLFIECTVHAAGLNDKLGAHLIDMETAAVAQAASILGVPWLAIKATTDSADGESAAAFAENLHAAARASAMAAEQAILLL